jgi:hypothetical protein
MKQGIRPLAALIAAACMGFGLIAILPSTSHAQLGFRTKWLAAGSLYNWYASTGSEVEEGRVTNQQDGLRWPSYYAYEDCQAAKGLWIGTTNFSDAGGNNYLYKVVHIGPRSPGADEFIPVSFEEVAKFTPPTVLVDGEQQLLDEIASVDRIDPTIDCDREIINVVNTSIGITMKRVIKQWSQQYHDNYHVFEYTFTNTGRTTYTDDVTLPGKTLTGVYFFFQNRYSINRDVGEGVYNGNKPSWGFNTMNDVRGDGIKPDPPGEQFRASFSWFGKFLPFTQFDVIGGPIWQGYWDKTDTVGRLGAAQFVGNVTLHADASPTDGTDDPNQPSTTGYINSDDIVTQSGRTQFDVAGMQVEYTNWIARGHMLRHADVVEPTGAFDQPTNDPSLGATGGNSSFNGYGPYTLAPGQSIHIVVAEGGAGLDRGRATSIGRLFKTGAITPKAKNDSVFQSRDSLFQTFRRAIASYNAGYAIPEGPWPPRSFTVTSGGDKITLMWEAPEGGPTVSGYRIYHCVGKRDSIFSLLATAGPTDRSYDDVNAIRGVPQYYYVQSVGADRPADPATLTPGGPLVSNRVYCQTGGATGKEATLKRQAGSSMNQIRIVPNPYSISSDANSLRIPGFPDRIMFYDIPGYCTIKIYTELGELIQTIVHNDGSGDEKWNSITSTNQVIVSGIYIVVFDNTRTGERTIRKLAVIR